MRLETGDRVRVYQRWMNHDDEGEPCEGLCKLLEFVGDETGTRGGAERWWVSFPDDGDEGPYFRTVWPQDKGG